jgi:hypothetical protein
VVAVGCFEPVMLGKNFLGFSETCMGGTITAQRMLKSSMRVFAHTVPVRPGDSGGPLLDLEGRLVGINEEVVITPFQPKRNIALMPPAEWMERMLRDDRAGTHERHEPLSERRVREMPKGSVSVLISLEEKMEFRVGDVVR